MDVAAKILEHRGRVGSRQAVTSSVIDTEGLSDMLGVVGLFADPMLDPQQLRAPKPPGPISNEVLEDLRVVAIEEDCLAHRRPPVFIGRLYPANRGLNPSRPNFERWRSGDRCAVQALDLSCSALAAAVANASEEGQHDNHDDEYE